MYTPKLALDDDMKHPFLPDWSLNMVSNTLEMFIRRLLVAHQSLPPAFLLLLHLGESYYCRSLYPHGQVENINMRRTKSTKLFLLDL